MEIDREWLEIRNEYIDGQALIDEIEHRLKTRQSTDAAELAEIVRGVRERVIGLPLFKFTWEGESFSFWENDCDIVPHYYVIDWRMPILGPINAFIRRLIHAEVKRYLLPALTKQTHFNRQVVQVLDKIVQVQTRE